MSQNGPSYTTKVPKEIFVVLHNGSTYDYHFIIKELAKEFKRNFECLGENIEKYITFSVPIKKKIENKDLEITHKIKFIDSYRFMSSSLLNLLTIYLKESITINVLCELATMSSFRSHSPHLVDNADTLYLGDQH